ncbi:hypothetical protein ACFVHB_28015 [Kitasatospora sp. NPDC127111]|uniref:hypothetical protein n=1 Tax=Kitasatospora sp. NPDC127111 TaxID=3345363 RepID=UPI003639FD9D
MTDSASAHLFGLALNGIEILMPLVGAIVAATHLRRRGRNARLAVIGCLVMLPGPIVLPVGLTVGFDALSDAFGPSAAMYVLSAISLPFHLIGFGLLLAGALSEPAAPVPAFGPPPSAPWAVPDGAPADRHPRAS